MIPFGVAAANTGLPKVLHLPQGDAVVLLQQVSGCSAVPPSPLLQDLPDSAETL